MPTIEKTPAEFATWIHEMYGKAPNPDAIPTLVEDIIKASRVAGHDEGVEAVVLVLEAVARDGPEPGTPDRENIQRGLQRLIDGALKLKKGKAL